MTTFEKELEALINKYSKENDSNTPDFLLAEYLVDCLHLFGVYVNKRAIWYGRADRPGQSTQQGSLDRMITRREPE